MCVLCVSFNFVDESIVNASMCHLILERIFNKLEESGQLEAKKE